MGGSKREASTNGSAGTEPVADRSEPLTDLMLSRMSSLAAQNQIEFELTLLREGGMKLKLTNPAMSTPEVREWLESVTERVVANMINVRVQTLEKLRSAPPR